MKKLSLKKMLALFLLAAMMLAAFTACSNGKAPDTSPSQQTQPAEAGKTEATTPEEPVTINFWHHYSAQSAENETLMNVLIPKFEEENPGYNAHVR